MKLLYCRICTDVFSLNLDVTRRCSCGRVEGRYVDGLNAVYSGDAAVPLAFANAHFLEAVASRPTKGVGRDFKAFVVPDDSASFRRIEKLRRC